MTIQELPDFVFNSEKHYLGRVCKLKHRYQGNQSIRRKCNGCCLYCERINNFDWDIEHIEKRRAISRKAYHRKKDSLIVKNRSKQKKRVLSKK
jgi:hypothetical protein